MRSGRATVVPVKAASRRIPQANPREEVSGRASGEKVEAKRMQPWCREMLSKARLVGTVPETDTGRKDEKSKAHERSRVKELGKMHT